MSHSKITAAGAIAAERLGFASAETGWRALVERIDLIDICNPATALR